VADFSGDGRPDMAVANETGGYVTVYVNNTVSVASGLSFGPAQNFPFGQVPVSLAVGDFNGTGRPDLVVANGVNGTVTVAMNTTVPGSSTVTFAAPQVLNVGGDIGQVVVGDFNGDGKPDIAFTDRLNGRIEVLLNTTPTGSTAPTFAAPQTYSVGLSPYDLAVADFNGDGRPDLVFTDFNHNSVTVALNTTPLGSSVVSFSAAATFPVDSGPTHVAVGDFNGDGRPDIAIVSNSSARVDVLLNTTAAGTLIPSFAPAKSFVTGANPQGIAVGDFDGDGRLDFAVSNPISHTVAVYANTTVVGNSSVSFASPQFFFAATGAGALQVGNFLNNGRADLVVADETGTTVGVLANNTPTAYTTPVTVAQIGNQGVQEYDHAGGSMKQLTPANASLLATDPNGDVVGEFPGYGLQLYRPTTGWQPINGVDASALAMNAQGEVVACFPGYGVGIYSLASGWKTLTPSAASLLAIDSLGDVVGEFPGYGLQLYRPTAGWQPINGVDASLLAMNAQGDIVANFHGYGVGEYTMSGGWQLINGVEATALTIDGNGDVMASFKGYGVGEYQASTGWKSLTGAEATLLSADALGRVFGNFAGYGLQEFDPWQGWQVLSASDASVLAVA
jgi:hypothetical protein